MTKRKETNISSVKVKQLFAQMEKQCFSKWLQARHGFNIKDPEILDAFAKQWVSDQIMNAEIYGSFLKS